MINGIVATGNSLATAFPLPSFGGDVMAFAVQAVPPGSGILLPQFIQSRVVLFLRNSGANNLLVYPLPKGTISGSLSPSTIAPGATLELWALSASDWVQMTGGGGGGGSGTVTSVSVVTANGVSGTVANPSTTPAITLAVVAPQSQAFLAEHRRPSSHCSGRWNKSAAYSLIFPAIGATITQHRGHCCPECTSGTITLDLSTSDYFAPAA
jgi:hypothetical protein